MSYISEQDDSRRNLLYFPDVSHAKEPNQEKVKRPTLLLAMMITMIGLVQTQDVNQRMVEYTISKEGKKVDRGECWDLVANALDRSGAQWDPPRGFGEKYDPSKVKVKAGDIMEFKNVKLQGDTWAFVFPQHFAIVTEVLGDNQYRIGHQNYNNKRRVVQTDIDLAYHKKGKITFYRPQGGS